MLYYRQKFLLGFLQKFDNHLQNTNCQKLLFLFCKINRIEYYDFFPYKYGGFSNVLYKDKRDLIEEGFLENTDAFSIKTKTNFLEYLKESDIALINNLKVKYGAYSRDELIFEAYRLFPYYAIRSEIPNEFAEKERNKIKNSLQNNKIIYSAGYEGKTIDRFLDGLILNNISLLIDVRRNPISRKYGFTGKKLANFLSTINIDYINFPNLGIESSKRASLNSTNDYLSLFNYYRESILKKEITSINEISDLIDKYKRVAILCFEKDYNKCHRTELINFIKNNQTSELSIRYL